MSPSFAAAAGILMVVGLAAVVWNLNSGGSNTPDINIASGSQFQNQQATEQPSQPIVQPVVEQASTNSNKEKRVKESQLSEVEVQRIINANYVKRGPKEVEAVPASARYLPGEESYIRTINDLEQSVSVQNASMSASSQVSYAKDIAVVDDSIKKMRDVVKKNPRNQAARQVLYSTYQDKIDLLKASSGRGEMMASLQY